jgi:TRAP-type C4-dicarboxylate transport system permease small subunit
VEKLIETGFTLIKYIMAALMAAMVIMVFSNVVLRYGLSTGIKESEELSRWCFVWMVFLGALVALRNRSHPGFDLVFKRLPEVMQRAFHVITRLVMLYIT